MFHSLCARNVYVQSRKYCIFVVALLHLQKVWINPNVYEGANLATAD